MQYIRLEGLGNEIYVFDRTDKLCDTCSYPLDEKGKGCLSCNIFHKYSQFTGGKIHFDKNISVGRYVYTKKAEKPAERSPDIMTWLIINYKKDEKWTPYCAQLLKTKIEESNPYLETPNESIIVCAVPDYKEKLYKKAELLSKKVAEELKLPYIPLIEKIRKTEKQHTITGKDAIKEKFGNVKGAFTLVADQISATKGKTVFLLDDVVSSMASVNECAKVLKEAGAASVFVFSLGRNILPEILKKEKEK